MESQRPGSIDAHENTPLLGAARDSENQRENEQGSQEAQDRESPISRPTVPASYKILFIFLSVQIAFGVLVLVFNIATYVIFEYGWLHYGTLRYTDGSSLTVVGWVIGFAILFSVANIARLMHSGMPFGIILNVFMFGFIAYALCGMSGFTFLDDLHWDLSCDPNLDSPNNRYKGTLEECRIWLPKYVVVIYVWLALVLLLGIFHIGLVLASLFAVYQSQSRRPVQNSSS